MSLDRVATNRESGCRHEVGMWEEAQAPNGRRNPTPTGSWFACSSAPEVPPTLKTPFQLTVGCELFNQICEFLLRSTPTLWQASA